MRKEQSSGSLPHLKAEIQRRHALMLSLVDKPIHLPATEVEHRPGGQGTLFLESSKMLGIFEAHVSSARTQVQEKAVEEQSLLRAKQALRQGRTVCFGMEHVAGLPAKIVKDLKKLFAHPEGHVEYERDVVQSLSLSSLSDPESEYTLKRWNCWRAMREEANQVNGEEKKPIVIGYLEHPPPMRYSHHAWMSRAFDRQIPQNIRIKYAADTMTALAMRDLKVANDMIGLWEKDPSIYHVLFRGTSHVGLVPAISMLSQGAYPGVDLQKKDHVDMQVPAAVVADLLWQKTFWDNVNQETGIIFQPNMSNQDFQKAEEKIHALILSDFWRGHLDYNIRALDNTNRKKGDKYNLNLVQRI